MRLLTAAALVLAVASGGAHAADTVTIGAIYPLLHDDGARAAIETAAEIINTPHAGLEKLPLCAGQGLPGLGGAKVAVSFADDLDNPSVATGQALRLITREHVAALVGAAGTAETLAATALAERHGIPFLVPDATAPSVTGRGFQWLFRTTPLAGDIARAYVQFLAAPRENGPKIASVALVFEDSEFGRSEAAALREPLKAGEFAVSDITYPADATDLSATAAQLRKQNPDAAIFISHTADAILFAKTLKNTGFKPAIEIGDDAGFSDDGFVEKVGNLAQGLLDHSAWSLGKPGSATAILNDLFKAKTGRDLDDTNGRVMQGFFVLADAINRAGSVDASAIQAALRATDLKPDQLIVGYDGVKFDATGQNTLAATYLTQLQGKGYVAVWPPDRATEQPQLPFKGWE
ncbi:MAG TPA: ABC transporter substrate-binding protein [Stellaceae bacterium]|nr:ABC transporter substrate-binding protein [Stellaceae bacterium]